MENTGIDEKTKLKIVRVAQAVVPDAKVYLFGSRARGTYKERSDIDIALDRGTPITLRDISEIRDMLNASNIPYKIEVLDLHSINREMKSVIEKEMIVWNEVAAKEKIAAIPTYYSIFKQISDQIKP